MADQYLHAHCVVDYIHAETGEKAFGYDLLEQFDDMLNEAYPEVEYCGYTCEPADAMRKLEPVGYRCAFKDWLNAEGWRDV